MWFGEIQFCLGVIRKSYQFLGKCDQSGKPYFFKEKKKKKISKAVSTDNTKSDLILETLQWRNQPGGSKTGAVLLVAQEQEKSLMPSPW